jgi:hypothetical protein
MTIGALPLEAEQDLARQLHDIIRTMMGIRTIAEWDESSDFTAGYIQALNDLLGWIREEYHL